MDYKYIEQLLEAYWECRTTIEEERILRTFFQQEVLPEQLAPYRHLFCYEAAQQKETYLDKAFDDRIMEKISSHKIVKARHISIRERLYPLYRAVAVVAVILTLGSTIEHAFYQWKESQYVSCPDQPLSAVPATKCDSNSTARQTATIKVHTDSIESGGDPKQDFALKH